MKINHNYFARLAFNLAESHLGKTNQNPSVGCVVVKNKSIISSGVTSINGRPHAEFNALNKDLDFENSHLYVTLEPCSHHGFTPPCTDIIKKKKIKKIFYCFDDPNPKTFRKAKKKLGKKITKLKTKIFKDNIHFYKSYYLNKEKNLPFIDAKIAISKDFFTINKKNKWITNLRSRKVAHLLRSKYDCIISTSKSINKDNSLLNCRIAGLNNYKPDLIIIDRYLNLNKESKLLNISKKRKTYIVTITKNFKKISFFKKRNVKIILLDKLEKKQDFEKLFKKIYKIGKGRVLIEAGLTFLNKLFVNKLINNLYVFKSNINIKKNGYNNSNINYLKKIKLKKKLDINLSSDSLFKVGIR